MHMNMELKKHMQVQYKELIQKRKTLWLVEGDTNSKFFFGKMSMRKHKNRVQALLSTYGDYIYGKEVIVQESMNY